MSAGLKGNNKTLNAPVENKGVESYGGEALSMTQGQK